MKKGTSESTKKRLLQKTLDGLDASRRAPRSFLVLMLLIHAVTSVTIPQISRAQTVVTLWGMQIPVAAFAGVVSSLGNICLIMLAVFCGKLGFFAAFIVLLAQFPMLAVNILRSHAYNSIPGIFSNILTLIAIVIIYVNIRQTEKYQDRIRNQAVTDSLTGIPNRFACSELLVSLVEQGKKFVAASIDLNNFKSINDSMGFGTGNEALKVIASRWKAIADGGLSGTLDFIARLSGDEFALVIRDYDSEEEVLNTIRQYMNVLCEKLTIDNCDFYVSASFGYAEYPTDSNKMDNLISYADAAMLEAKRSGNSDLIVRFTRDLLKEEHTLEIEKKIHAALENDGIFFQLQPQYDMNQKLRGFEALARMRDEEGKLISPGEFIPVAEKVGLIDKIDVTVFRKAAAFFGKLLRKTNADITLSVNVSVRHLMKNDFLQETREVLERNGIPTKNLEVEITESVMIDSAERALQCINSLKEMGVQIAIDDFGTGYSSLSYLNSFPADLLKIDKSFVDKMNDSDSMRQYVAAIISMGHIMGFDVISEGVEQQQQMETLQSIHCDFIQGFLWGRPLSAEDAEKVAMDNAEKFR
ncbi:MAG: EAL domain-containing protein [Lachnospiraceae bacterium]|nr:EAL domain-containing protein [Lachnospiraceae bacterium]MBR3507965.1 EAL domain-containing protein [Lachnospiraceae bacterium]MBR4608537.1 EAL domain-containing protein [Lachnospiraceae bacterium]MBR6151239.1 EAL domain-containing protein [Lachnospiraceae bacterium]